MKVQLGAVAGNGRASTMHNLIKAFDNRKRKLCCCCSSVCVSGRVSGPLSVSLSVSLSLSWHAFYPHLECEAETGHQVEETVVSHSKESVPDDVVELCMYDLNITLTTSKMK